LGVRHEGLAEGYLRIAGVWEDHMRFGITAEEWEERRDELWQFVSNMAVSA
jgi:ribosomal-protein-alanine N-acetyltransferase